MRQIKVDKHGNTIEEVKLHPSLFALPKMISELGMSPDNFMITPKAQEKKKSEDEAVKTLADFMSAAGAQLAAAREKKKE